MPAYSVELLTALKDSALVKTPEFVWNEIETVPRTQPPAPSTWSKPQEPKKPAPLPKAAIPFSQKSLFSSSKKEAEEPKKENEEEEEEVELDDDEYAAKYLLKSQPKNKKTTEVREEKEELVNLSYAAALAATMKMSTYDPSNDEPAPQEAAEEDGWISVTNQKQRRPRQNHNSRW